MEDPSENDDDDAYWDMCVEDIDKVVQAAIEKKAANQQAGSSACKGQSQPPQRLQQPPMVSQQRPLWQAPAAGRPLLQTANAAPRQPHGAAPASQTSPFPASPMVGVPSADNTEQHRHPAPVADGVQQEVWRMQEEVRQQVEAMKEKDGAISILRSRLQTVEGEAFELRKRSAGISASSQQSSTQQTNNLKREVERLRGQLLFKEQEVIDAKRAKAEKDLKIKEAQEASQRLEAELRTMQQQRSSPTSASKRRRGSDAGSPTGPLALNQQLNRLTSEQGRSPKALFKSPSSKSQQSQVSERREPNALRAAEVPLVLTSAAPVVDPSKDERVGNGHVAEVQTGMAGNAKLVETGSESVRTLRRLERVALGLQEAKSGTCFMQRLFAVCSDDVYTLVSGGKGEGGSPKDAPAVMQALAEAAPMEVEGSGECEAFRDALTKVTTGLKPPVALLPPLLAALNSDAGATVQASLRVLRPLLRFDFASRSALLGASAAPDLGANWIPVQIERPSLGAEQPSSSSTFSTTTQTPRLSPRVVIGPASKAQSRGNKEAKGKAAMSFGADPSDSCQDAPKGQELDRGFFERLLKLAVESEQPRAQFEAASILALLIVHVPADLRTSFEFLVRSGHVIGLLGPQVPPAVQGVALHVVHVLCESRGLSAAMFGSESASVTGKRPETDALQVAVRTLFAVVVGCLGSADLILKHSAIQLMYFVCVTSTHAEALLVSLGRDSAGTKEPQRGSNEAGQGADKRCHDDVAGCEPSVVVRLLHVLDEELHSQAAEPNNVSEERAALLGEACRFLSRLVTKSSCASEALGTILRSSCRTRLAISVTTRLNKQADKVRDIIPGDYAGVVKALHQSILNCIQAHNNEMI